MNIFYLSKNVQDCAKQHCDKHVVKMILEYAQLLSTAHRVLDGSEYTELSVNNRRIKRWRLTNNTLENTLYKATHVNHPSAKWVREGDQNYQWLYNLFTKLLSEYTYRYGKVHACTKLVDVLKSRPKNIPLNTSTVCPQAMPDYCKSKDPVTGYRTYYLLEKSKLLNYTKRSKPSWI